MSNHIDPLHLLGTLQGQYEDEQRTIANALIDLIQRPENEVIHAAIRQLTDPLRFREAAFEASLGDVVFDRWLRLLKQATGAASPLTIGPAVKYAVWRLRGLTDEYNQFKRKEIT